VKSSEFGDCHKLLAHPSLPRWRFGLVSGAITAGSFVSADLEDRLTTPKPRREQQTVLFGRDPGLMMS
jgi:hypothetical protein